MAPTRCRRITTILNSRTPAYKEPDAYKTGVQAALKKWLTDRIGPPPWRPTDPDFDPLFGSDMLQIPGSTKLYGATFAPVNKKNGAANEFHVAFPYIEREWYFTTDKSPQKINTSLGVYEWDYGTDHANLNVRIPNRSIKLDGAGEYGQTQNFIPLNLERSSLNQPVIAPILPGHYGVVGSAGTNYGVDPIKPPDPSPTAQIYTSTIGRREFTGQSNNLDKMHEQSVLAHSIRRIEMRPNAELPSPPIHQLRARLSRGSSFSSGTTAAIRKMKSNWGTTRTKRTTPIRKRSLATTS